ncbi:LysR substrate-binding domain-containing protein, partial [Aurantimonas sp. C2-4-R8]|nr:LysR substrate-binding domain-containing protein [Aurantimonas sp. C2-4-R8]
GSRRLVFFDLGHYHVDTLPAPSRVNSRVVDVSSSLARREIAWADLYERRFIVSKSDPGPEIHDYLVKHLARLGHHPSVEYCAVGRDNLMHLVSLGKGLTLTSEATTGTTFPSVVYRTLSGEELPFCAIWSPMNDNPALRRLLSLARVMARRNGLCNGGAGASTTKAAV